MTLSSARQVFDGNGKTQVVSGSSKDKRSAAFNPRTERSDRAARKPRGAEDSRGPNEENAAGRRGRISGQRFTSPLHGLKATAGASTPSYSPPLMPIESDSTETSSMTQPNSQSNE